jgi:hypothetical protein
MFDHVLDGWTAQDVDTLAGLLAKFNDSFAAQRDSLPGLLQQHPIKENA